MASPSLRPPAAPGPLRGAKVLVTGGTGSIGLELVRQCAVAGAPVVRVLSNDENSLYEAMQLLGEGAPFRYLVGDVRDKTRLSMACEGIDIVFHCAALKHVPLSGYNPSEAIKTNVLGSQNLIEVALEQRVKKVVGISTDKAVDPVSTMGVTKLLMERLLIDAMYYVGAKPTNFSCVRFGNVLLSRGSVVPLFLRQIAQGGPVTITDRRMVRYFMSTQQAVGLILRAAGCSNGGETFILKMDRVGIMDLAKTMVKVFAPRFGHDPRAVKVVETGVRGYEKLSESLVFDHEWDNLYESGDLYLVRNLTLRPLPPGFRRCSKPRQGALNARLPRERIEKLMRSIPAGVVAGWTSAAAPPGWQ